MKVGDNVRCTVDGKIGKCLGPVYHFHVWWMKVAWVDGATTLAHKDYLDVISEGG